MTRRASPCADRKRIRRCPDGKRAAPCSTVPGTCPRVFLNWGYPFTETTQHDTECNGPNESLQRWAIYNVPHNCPGGCLRPYMFNPFGPQTYSLDCIGGSATVEWAGYDPEVGCPTNNPFIGLTQPASDFLQYVRNGVIPTSGGLLHFPSVLFMSWAADLTYSCGDCRTSGPLQYSRPNCCCHPNDPGYPDCRHNYQTDYCLLSGRCRYLHEDYFYLAPNASDSPCQHLPYAPQTGLRTQYGGYGFVSVYFGFNVDVFGAQPGYLPQAAHCQLSVFSGLSDDCTGPEPSNPQPWTSTRTHFDGFSVQLFPEAGDTTGNVFYRTGYASYQSGGTVPDLYCLNGCDPQQSDCTINQTQDPPPTAAVASILW